MRQYQFKSGDIIGFSGRGFISDVVNIGTYGIPRWSISHVAIIAGYGENKLYEANENDTISGVSFHKPHDKIDEYKGRIWIYPLYRKLYYEENCRLNENLSKFLNTPYDTLGAIRSAGFIFSIIESLIHGPDFVKLFCSELVAQQLSDIGIYPTSNASRWNPNKYLRRLRLNGIVCKPIRLK